MGEVLMQAMTEIMLDPEKNYEIVNGHPEEKEVPGTRHSGICGRLERRLGNYAETNNLGEVYPGGSFQIGKNERIPDLAFISAERIPLEGEPETKSPIPPDLAIEVVSPNDLYEKVLGKTLEYLAAGVKQIWIVSPENQTITIYRSTTNITAVPPDSELVSEDLLPGFRCRLSEIFKNPRKDAI
ncbi:MAG TPA: Uma2 family endonuclease [Blastocatellia bacterium]|nr:Uma2 family endonuclease [Blastocatellia bacterium]